MLTRDPFHDLPPSLWAKKPGRAIGIRENGRRARHKSSEAEAPIAELWADAGQLPSATVAEVPRITSLVPKVVLRSEDRLQASRHIFHTIRCFAIVERHRFE